MNIKLGGQVQCQFLTDFSSHELPAASSCGLDFWQSQDALGWVASFLNAVPAVLEVTAGRRSSALCCLLRRLPFGLTLASAYPYGAISGDIALFWRSGHEIIAMLREHGVARLEIPFTGEYANQFPETRLSRTVKLFTKLNAVRHIIDFERTNQDHESFMSKLPPKVRWAIRKAERTGVVQVAGPDDFHIVQSLYEETMRAKGAPVNYGKERFKGMLDNLRACGHAEIYLGLLDSQPIGMAAVIDADTSRHLIQVAVPPKGQWSRMSELLVYQAIRDAIIGGKRYFDFMASSLKDKGLTAFKGKWNSTAQPIRYAGFNVSSFYALGIDVGRRINATHIMKLMGSD